MPVHSRQPCVIGLLPARPGELSSPTGGSASDFLRGCCRAPRRESMLLTTGPAPCARPAVAAGPLTAHRRHCYPIELLTAGKRHVMPTPADLCRTPSCHPFAASCPAQTMHRRCVASLGSVVSRQILPPVPEAAHSHLLQLSHHPTAAGSAAERRSLLADLSLGQHERPAAMSKGLHQDSAACATAADARRCEILRWRKGSMQHAAAAYSYRTQSQLGIGQ